MKDIIKNYFQGYSKRGIINGFSKFLRNNPEVEKYLNNILTEKPNWENTKNIVYGICFDKQLKQCKNCGKEMKYSQGLYHNYCSYKCSTSSKEIQEKIKQTNLERYGAEHPLQNKEVQEKIRQTNLEKYGCKYSFQNKKVQERYKQTCIERYGCENPLQNKEVQENIKQTNLKRYGTERIFQSEKIKQILHDNSYDNLIPKFIEYGITPLFPKEEYTGYDKTYRWKCLICQNEFEQTIYPTSHIKECQLLPHCWKCYPRMSSVSRVELELLDFVKQYYPNAHKDNELIKPKELDIIIPEIKLAIEYNGDYWHSVEFYLNKYGNLDEYYGYHLNKTLEANKKGYRLIHIWENEYNNLIPKLKNILECKEDLTFTEDTIKLDRSWYNNVEIPGYELVEELPPEIMKRSKFNVENCGYLVYERIK